MIGRCPAFYTVDRFSCGLRLADFQHDMIARSSNDAEFGRCCVKSLTSIQQKETRDIFNRRIFRITDVFSTHDLRMDLSKVAHASVNLVMTSFL